jgi:predicted amidohydrolase
VSTNLRVAVAQFGAVLGEVETNLGRMEALLAEASAGGAELACFPELCLSGYLLERDGYTADLLDAVEAADARLAATAERTGMALVYGAPLREGGDLRNSVVLQQPEGRRLVYAKTHMDVKERQVFAAGDAFVVDDAVGLGLACCYDLAFPEAPRLLGLRGARVLLVPMAWELERGFVLASVVAARAVENLAYVVCANQAGSAGSLSFRGASCVIDPLGRSLAELGAAEGVAFADLDLGLVDRLRDRSDVRSYPLLADRRPDLYGPLGSRP